jgi:hypothetical protein
MPRIAAFVTPHGYGHAAIVTAVLDAVLARRDDVEVTLVTTVPESVLRGQLPHPFAHVPHAGRSDFGLLMTSSTGVRVAESAAAYAAAHTAWPAVVAEEAALLRRLAPDLVLSCAGYACLAAAADLGIPAAGLGPFSWRSVFAAYCGDSPAATRILEQMDAAYGAASLFLETTPAVPTGLPNVRRVGPVGRPQAVDGGALRRRLGLGDDTVLALLALGGIAESVDLRSWPAMPGISWLVAGSWAGRSDMLPVAAAGVSVPQAIQACDVVVTKPGYGTFVEAACGGTAVLYRARLDWPETDGLSRWLGTHVPVDCIDDATFSRGALADKLHMLVQGRRDPLGHPFGNEQAADLLEMLL